MKILHTKQEKVSKILLRIGAAAAAVLLSAALILQGRRQQFTPERTLLQTSTEREGWLLLRGWKVGEPEVSEIRIPASWQTAAGMDWLNLQHLQGFSPENYAGSSAERMVFPILNAPNAYYRAELLFCGDELVGAQIYDASTQLMQTVR